MSLEFEWDPAKAEENNRKHGVTFEEAATVLAIRWRGFSTIPNTLLMSPREIIVGCSQKPRLLLVSFAERAHKVRIISARPATRGERQSHEQNVKKGAQKPS